ncbi:uncharacterized protein A4U43_C05F35480 [Asparagus officinalis]|uniref:DUF632 domain-containing protein n=1 Tax=Asparagus officinalis TaxID=4686 RepID=A0A5P1EXM6_ASPOF|nr:uncharacterized protein A4U43_C05F35480 [Asparagus officinalis]
MEVSEARDAVEVEAGARNGEAEETPGFTVYVNRRPNSMVDVIKDLENQFVRTFDSAKEVSVMLEANSAQYSAPTELTGARILNPASLFSAPSSRSSSARFLQSSINAREDQGDEASSNYSEECCMISGSHRATLDRLYAWEKKLYEEVKRGERIRIAYDKKCMQLRNHDVNGEEPSVVDKTRAAIRDLHTRLKVSIHSVESVSRRIEALRDEELYPQLLELIQGLARMWKTMSDCHKIQKRTIDEAKLLLFSYAANTNLPKPSDSSRFKPSRHAAALISDLRNWRSTLSSYITAQRSYVHALSDWISRCAASQISADEDQTSQSPFRIGGARAMPLFRLCFHWSRVVDSVSEGEVVEGLERLAAGIGVVDSVSEGEVVEGLERSPKASVSVNSINTGNFGENNPFGHAGTPKRFEPSVRADPPSSRPEAAPGCGRINPRHACPLLSLT